MSRTVIGITGAQGVGKSTFCQHLSEVLSSKSSLPVRVLPSIGEVLKQQGIVYGSSATAESVLAIFSAHLNRTRLLPEEGVVLIDRCAADALSYTRALGLNSEVEVTLLTEICHAMASGLDLIVHLERTGIFEVTQATHESIELRSRVADLFPGILKELGRPYRSVYAADSAAVSEVVAEILSIC